MISSEISLDALDKLFQREAETIALETCITVAEARATIEELWDDGELAVRSMADGKRVLWRLENRAA